MFIIKQNHSSSPYIIANNIHNVKCSLFFPCRFFIINSIKMAKVCNTNFNFIFYHTIHCSIKFKFQIEAINFNSNIIIEVNCNDNKKSLFFFFFFFSQKCSSYSSTFSSCEQKRIKSFWHIIQAQGRQQSILYVLEEENKRFKWKRMVLFPFSC